MPMLRRWATYYRTGLRRTRRARRWEVIATVGTAITLVILTMAGVLSVSFWTYFFVIVLVQPLLLGRRRVLRARGVITGPSFQPVLEDRHGSRNP